MMLLGNRIALRDMTEVDIADFVRWYTVETEWQMWDAPWEWEAAAGAVDVAAIREQWRKQIPTDERSLRKGFQIYTRDGIHIGWVNSYCMTEITARHRAIGIDIPARAFRGQGFGEEAYALLIQYFLENGVDEVFTQTWSGNTPMLRLAEKIGFVVYTRKIGSRIVRGKSHDGITLRLDHEMFASRHLLRD